MVPWGIEAFAPGLQNQQLKLQAARSLSSLATEQSDHHPACPSRNLPIKQPHHPSVSSINNAAREQSKHQPSCLNVK